MRLKCSPLPSFSPTKYLFFASASFFNLLASRELEFVGHLAFPSHLTSSSYTSSALHSPLFVHALNSLSPHKIPSFFSLVLLHSSHAFLKCIQPLHCCQRRPYLRSRIYKPTMATTLKRDTDSAASLTVEKLEQQP